jgi:hypothetical protein
MSASGFIQKFQANPWDDGRFKSSVGAYPPSFRGSQRLNPEAINTTFQKVVTSVTLLPETLAVMGSGFRYAAPE